VYDNTFKQYLEAGYIKEVSIDRESNCWYLPHFAVIREDRSTTKIRPVFDGSAKFKGFSLNDLIYDCPNLQSNLFDVLLRFRKNPIALTCDIEKMYLNIGIPESDRRCFRFLWHDEAGKLICYEFQVVVFGSKCAPAQANFVTQNNAKKH
jgi:hypothetical protein